MRITSQRIQRNILEGVDPRTRVLAFLFVLSDVLCFNHPAYVAAVLGILLVTSIVLGAFRLVIRSRWVIIVLVTLSTVTWWVQMSGATLFESWRDVDLTGAAMMFSLSMGLRMAALLVAGLVFFHLTKPTDSYDALIAVRVPHAVAFAFSLSMGLLPAYLGKASEILESQTARGLDLRAGGMWQRTRKFVAIAIPLFMQMLRHTHLLAIALESRGFSPLRKRTSYREFKFGARDYVVVGMFAALNCALLFLRSRGIGILPYQME